MTQHLGKEQRERIWYVSDVPDSLPRAQGARRAPCVWDLDSMLSPWLSHVRASAPGTSEGWNSMMSF